jgi:phosphoesterase RecJ-like protein
MGKRVICRCDTPPVEMFRWLGVEIDNRRNLPSPDAIIGLDFGQRQQQLGPLYQAVAQDFQTRPVINIDHHYLSNERYGTVNIVADIASTTMLLHELFNRWRVTIDSQLAEYLLFGIYTDTHYFQKSNTSPEVLAVASHLAALGADPYTIAQRIHKTRSPAAMRFWGEVMSSLRMYHAGQLAVASVSRDMLERYRLEESALNLDGLVNSLTAVESTRITALLKERREEVRVSLRSDYYQSKLGDPPRIIDVCAIARQFGGGGHIAAAGCSIPGSLAEAEARIVQVCVEALKDG